MRYSWNEEKILKLLKDDEEKVSKQSNPELRLEIYSIRTALNMPIIDEVKDKNNNQNSSIIISSASYIFKKKLVFDTTSSKKILSKKEIVKKARSTMALKDKRCFSKTVRNGFFNMSNNNSQTFCLPAKKMSLINVTDRGILSDARNIVHEVTHASYFNELTYSELVNYYNSNLKETLPILGEMFFIDRLDSYKEILNEQSIFLNNFYNYKNIKEIDAYAQSFTLAEYLFMLYKTDKSKFNDNYYAFSELLKNKSDKEIIHRLAIDPISLMSSNEKYIRLYRR